MPLPIAQIDAFTDAPFGGNPAGVCLLPSPRDDAWMQAVAREMNCANTAFLVPDGGEYRIRWFTPAAEVDLCGHATLASAHWLWETGALSRDMPVRFQSKSGPLGATLADGWITLDFPATPPAPADAPPELEGALGARSVCVERSKFDYLVELNSDATVRALAPDLAAVSRIRTRGVIVTARSADPKFDFVSRFFAPAIGIPEDPVTGSAHCALAPYWSARLGKQKMNAYQASSRGGVLRLALAGDRVRLSGRAVTVLRAELLA